MVPGIMILIIYRYNKACQQNQQHKQAITTDIDLESVFHRIGYQCDSVQIQGRYIYVYTGVQNLIDLTFCFYSSLDVLNLKW